MQFPSRYSPSQRSWLKVAILSCVVLSLICASTVPFLWESKSLWYKFGIDKTLLQMGKVAGLCAAVLLYLQILLALRFKLLDRLFGLDRVYFIHQLNGYLIVGLVLLHVSLVLIPEGIKNLPIGWKFWPEIVGAAAFLLLIGIAVSAKLKNRFIAYHLWRRFHRPFGYLLVATISIHIFYVSDSFENTVPRYTLFGIFGSVALLVMAVKIRNQLLKRNYFDIEEIVPVSEEIVSIHLSGPSSFHHLPGQFAFLRFAGSNISAEPHPFTIASAPGYNDTLQFYIKKSGDWTSEMPNISKGNPVVQGPYGLFSYKCREETQCLVFIAAGIGITPMLSMLRDLTQRAEQPEIVLIWSLRYRSEMFLKNELKEIQRNIARCTIHIVYTREDNGRRITKELLTELLTAIPNNSHIYICGPEKMMKSTRAALINIGYPKKHIFWERFAL